MPYVICYIEGKPRFSDFQYSKYPLLQDKLTFIKYRNALRLQCHNHTGLTMKLVIFFPNKLSIRSSLTKWLRFVWMDQFWLTVTCTHCEISLWSGGKWSALSFSVSGVWFFTERNCIERIQNYIGSSYIKSAYCVNRLLCNLLWSGGRIFFTVYVTYSLSFTFWAPLR